MLHLPLFLWRWNRAAWAPMSSPFSCCLHRQVVVYKCNLSSLQVQYTQIWQSKWQWRSISKCRYLYILHIKDLDISSGIRSSPSTGKFFTRFRLKQPRTCFCSLIFSVYILLFIFCLQYNICIGGTFLYLVFDFFTICVCCMRITQIWLTRPYYDFLT